MSPGSENLRKTKRQLLEDIERFQRQISKLKLAASGRVSGVSLKDRVADSYRTVVEDQTEMIARHLPNGILTFVNRAYCQYHRRTREELIGTNFYLLLSPPNRRIVRKNISSLSQDNPVVTNLQQVLTPDGEERWHQWFNRAIFDRKGKMIEFQAVGRNITDLKNIEKDLKQKEAALKDQKEALERKNVALHEILEKIEICDLIKNGFTSKEIADLLPIAFNTVEAHRTHIHKNSGLTEKR